MATESTPGEKVVAVGQGSPSTATSSENAERLSALLSWRPARNGSDQLGRETVGRSEEQTREKETVCDAGLCVFEPGVCLLWPYGRAHTCPGQTYDARERQGHSVSVLSGVSDGFQQSQRPAALLPQDETGARGDGAVVRGRRRRLRGDGALHGPQRCDHCPLVGAYGADSEGLHNALFRGLVLKLVQLDELYAKVRDSEQARWLWLAIDPITR